MKRDHGYLAEFADPKALYHAAKEARDAGFKNWDVHSPYPIHGMDAAMGLGRSKLPHFVFFGGAFGLFTGFTLATATQTDTWGGFWKFLSVIPGLDSIPYTTVVQAKPTNIFTTPAFFPIMFELTVLFSAFTTLFVLLALCKLPRLHHPLFESENFAKATDDGFFLCIEARDPKFSREDTPGFLEKIGAESVELVQEEI